jgi:phosphoesterase RecJ-like protein
MLSDLKVGILFKEEKDEKIRVSLRSSGNINIRKIAAKFSGGGHLNAAGCIIKDKLSNVENLVLNEVRKIVK